MNKQPKVTEATKQAFVDAFCELCKTTPIEKITVQALTRKAGYNRCTFYSYFNNVNELLEHIENKLISNIKANIFETIKNVNIAEKYISQTLDILKKQETYIEVLLLNSHSSSFSKRLKSVMIPAFMLKYNIAENDKKSKYVLEYHLSGLIALMTSWIVNGRDIPMKHILDVSRSTLREGILKILDKKNNKSALSVVDKSTKLA